MTGGFTDSQLPANYGPFGIQTLTVEGNPRIFVSYAQHVTGSNDNANGAGLGLVNVFDTHGTLITRLVPTGGKLRCCRGALTLAPDGFGTLSGALLVGNFGDGTINAYKPTDGTFIGTLSDSNGTPIATPGLWGIAFGNGARNQPAKTLYFAAGVGGETGGLYGRIDLGATAPDIVLRQRHSRRLPRVAPSVARPLSPPRRPTTSASQASSSSRVQPRSAK